MTVDSGESLIANFKLRDAELRRRSSADNCINIECNSSVATSQLNPPFAILREFCTELYFNNGPNFQISFIVVGNFNLVQPSYLLLMMCVYIPVCTDLSGLLLPKWGYSRGERRETNSPAGCCQFPRLLLRKRSPCVC